MRYDLKLPAADGPVNRDAVGKKKLKDPQTQFDVVLPVRGAGKETVQIVMSYYYCQEGGEGLCKVGKVVFSVPLVVAADGSDQPVELKHVVPK